VSLNAASSTIAVASRRLFLRREDTDIAFACLPPFGFSGVSISSISCLIDSVSSSALGEIGVGNRSGVPSSVSTDTATDFDFGGRPGPRLLVPDPVDVPFDLGVGLTLSMFVLLSPLLAGG
jgi:hypothetical protein